MKKISIFGASGLSVNILIIAVSKLLLMKNDISQIAKKPIRDGRLALLDFKNEFC